MMSYQQAVKYLNSFIDYEKTLEYAYGQSLKLERISGFLQALGNPQDELRCIHIAGTKGKGSVCAFIAYMLRQANFKVGLYTSPHLSDFRERIRVLNPRIAAARAGKNRRRQSRQESPPPEQARIKFEGMISKKELAVLIERLMPSIEKYNSLSEYGALSFFEVYTALAFVYFKEKRVDFAVLETGLGGRLDATNTVNSLIAAITPVSYEHSRQLGGVLAQIAFEKAGIIKAPKGARIQGHKSIVVSAPQEKQVMQVIRDRCKEVNASLYEVGRDITYEKMRDKFRVKGVFGKYPNLRIRLLGGHQLINATVAIAVVGALRFFNVEVRIDSIRKGLYNTIWPARCEVVSEQPMVVLDGAQNAASSNALSKAVKENFKYKKLILVLGISRDKDIKGICRALIPISRQVIITQANNPRAADMEIIEKFIRSNKQEAGSRIFKRRKVKQAIELAREKAAPKDLILVTGSLFLAGQVRSLFLK